MIRIEKGSYLHPDKTLLFENLTLLIHPGEKIAIVGNNGTGKSTLLQVIAGRLPLAAGTFETSASTYYVPQVVGQYNSLSVADALGIAGKLKALHEILRGNVTEEHLSSLQDDWTVEERVMQAMRHWHLPLVSLSSPMSELSGGQKTKVFLAGIMVHQPRFVVLDEPSNHLDEQSRALLYDYIQTTGDTLVVASHDRKLLQHLPIVCELSAKGLSMYGGNYAFYEKQKSIASAAQSHALQEKEKTLRKARQQERISMERKHRMDARGKRKQEKSGLPRISMNTFRNKAEESQARMKESHGNKIETLSDELLQLRKLAPTHDTMRLDFTNTILYHGKILVTVENLQIRFGGQQLWKTPLSFILVTGERIAIRGANGSGKTTLLKLLLNQQSPTAGSVRNEFTNAIYIDQDYSMLHPGKSVYQLADVYAAGKLQEHEIKTRLNRFLFSRDDWDKGCADLSGGEKMRLLLCCLTLLPNPPDLIMLDEPTNNLDLQNIDILTEALEAYRGTLVVVSHDADFLDAIRIARTIDLI